MSSEETIHKQKFKIDQWPTTKVTIFPTRAVIVRQIEEVELHPGLNEITISDLTSLADQDSIRVSGTTDSQPARINDLTVDSVRKPPSFDQSLDDESDSEEEEDEKPSSLLEAEKPLETTDKRIADVWERRAAAENELDVLKTYTNAMSSKSAESADPDVMKAALALYSAQRKVHYDTSRECTAELEELQKARVKQEKVLAKETRAFQRSIKAKVEARAKRKQEKVEKKVELDEKKPETTSAAYRVRITIDLPISLDDSEKDATATQVATLTLTYTTSAATWSPQYDLRLDTTNPSLSTLTYRAHFINRTYETWTNVPITLSTSQASFGGLNEKIPQMQPWRATARKSYGNMDEHGLFSLAEKTLQEAEKAKLVQNYYLPMQQQQMQQQQMQQQQIYQAQQIMQQNITKLAERGERLDSLADKSDNLAVSAQGFRRGANESRAPTNPIWGHYASSSWGGSAPASAPRPRESKEEEEEESNDFYDEVNTLAPAPNPILHAAGAAESYGLTTTYDLPTPRTIPSSPLVRRHVIAEISLPQLVLSHILIAKLKPAAFLKARLTNSSHIPLLPGPAGLTLDGSFLGNNLAFQRCAPGETVVLELGVDTGVKVEYERPIVKRGTQGGMAIFGGKEEVGVFRRNMRITNAKGGPVSLVVLDQVPVPEDDKLTVSILVPKGLSAQGDVARNVGADGKVGWKASSKAPSSPAVATPSKKLEGIPEDGRRDSRIAPSPSTSSFSATPNTWGTAKATHMKNGEIRWDVDLQKGSSVALALEWECRVPGGDVVHCLS